MDRVFGIRRVSREMALQYVPGDCHVCFQSGVRVRRLTCGRHNYCRMCADFQPRLVNGDFSCKQCQDGKRRRGGDRAIIDDFLALRTGTPATLTGDQRAPADAETVDDTDLDGNNAEWEHLLQPASTSSTLPRASSFQEEFLPIPRKSSFLHLVIPTASKESSDSSPSPNQPTMIQATVTQLLSAKLENLKQVRQTNQTRSGSSSDSSVCAYTVHAMPEVLPRSEMPSPVPRTPPPSARKADERFNIVEEERGSSPCKGIRSRSDSIWYDVDEAFPKSESQMELEQLKDDIGDIEGPGFSSSSSRSASCDSLTSSGRSSRKQNFDSFWDS
ncbi:uncharacterized protein LOC128208403 [Mya arenaria]|uniref:uncharacterized protein LOC128208403 n=1 Tax=Mya arenaria TaxID=6604 RepID=UPI0022E92ECE|nr:uncharacterized protein LOC128208403 [Mya arenaria]